MILFNDSRKYFIFEKLRWKDWFYENTPWTNTFCSYEKDFTSFEELDVYDVI
jgi:hypothetical protein